MSKIVKHQTSLQNKNVAIANVVTRAAQGLTLAEKRILFAGIAQLSGINKEVKLTAEEYANTFDLDLNTAYTQLKAATEKLVHRYLRWQIQDGKHLGTLTCNWLQGYKYFDGEGYVKFLFSEYIFPFLFELHGGAFTKYQLKQACALRSVYSWRLLEMMEQMRESTSSDGWLHISLEEFWHAMGAKESHKKNFGVLRNWVIEPAVKEMTEKDNWIIKWEAIKKGRKVVALRFDFQRNPQGQLEL